MSVPPPLPFRLGAFLPLIAVGVEIAWLLVLLMGYLFMVGDMPPKHGTPAQEQAKTQLMDAVAILPAVLGLLAAGVGVVRGWPRGPVQWTCLILGGVGCSLFVISFGYEFLFG
jgi:hypothetical protein